MAILLNAIIKRNILSKSTLLWFGFIVVLSVGFLSYLDFNSWEHSTDMFSDLPAAVFPATENITGDASDAAKVADSVGESNKLSDLNDLETAELQEKYIGEAKEGEGVTHLARRALRGYLNDNSQSFIVTPEHKIYIEDYLVKKTGEKNLQLSERVEFSEGLINSAVQEAKKLTSSQLENLAQFSRLVPSLNY